MLVLYWNKLKQCLKDEGNETVTNCHALKMKAADGKRRFNEVANTEQLHRIYILLVFFGNCCTKTLSRVKM